WDEWRGRGAERWHPWADGTPSGEPMSRSPARSERSVRPGPAAAEGVLSVPHDATGLVGMASQPALDEGTEHDHLQLLRAGLGERGAHQRRGRPLVAVIGVGHGV